MEKGRQQGGEENAEHQCVESLDAQSEGYDATVEALVGEAEDDHSLMWMETTQVGQGSGIGSLFILP